MSIRPMTNDEIVKGLRHAAEVCVEKKTARWWSIDVCRADGTFKAADAFAGEGWNLDGETDVPEDAATFLLLCAEAHQTKPKERTRRG
jgi:hypothetical protein